MVYSDVKWSAALTLKEPWLDADTTQSGNLFQSGIVMEKIFPVVCSGRGYFECVAVLVLCIARILVRLDVYIICQI